jgi:predicted RNA-binding protein (virulence factor B family)
MLEIGKTASLEVLRAVPMGVILGSAEDEVLLPTRYVPAGTAPGDVIEVFLYTDSEDRPIATTERPLAQADEFACLRVVSVSRVGAFLAWGLPKDLLLPFRSQLRRVRPEERVVVRILCDPVSGRPVATAKIDRFLEQPPDDLREGQEVRLLIYEETELGSKAIVDGRFGGLVYRDPGDGTLEIGASPVGYVQRIRADGKLDLRLTPSGRAAVDAAREKLLEGLRSAGGRLELGDHSEPEEIRRILGLSKKAFKRAVGSLYRERRIRIADGWIELTGPDGASPPPKSNA